MTYRVYTTALGVKVLVGKPTRSKRAAQAAVDELTDYGLNAWWEESRG